MTTPQSQLYYLADRIKELCEMFRGSDDEDDIFEKVRQIESQQIDLISSNQRIENLLNLIVKFLGKDES